MALRAWLVTGLPGLAGCSGHGGSSSATTPEGPVAWRGAVITGVHRAAHLDEVEAAWQTAIAQNGAAHDPVGWTVVLEPGFPPDCGLAHLGPCDGITIPASKTVEVSTQGPPQSHPTEEILTFEFCHVVLIQRGGTGLGPNCPI